MVSTYVEPQLRWLGSKRFWAFVLLLCVGVVAVAAGRAVWLAHRKAEPAEAFLYGQPEMTPGVPAVFRVFVRNAVDQTPLKGAVVQSHGDHRLAMSLAVAALVAEGPTTIEDVACVSTSFPTFWSLLDSIRA